MSANTTETAVTANGGVNSFLFGRRQIFTTSDTFTTDNIIYEVNTALAIHTQNMIEEETLYWYRRGVQPVLNRTKDVRPEICNKVVVNNAEQVCVFKNGYFYQRPAYYISRKEDKETTDKVRQLNEWVYASGKTHADTQVVNWFDTVGLGAMFVEPNDDPDKPFNVFALDPRSAFVVYSLRPGNKPVMGVYIVVDNGIVKGDVFTKDTVFHLSGTATGRFVTEDPVWICTFANIDSIEPNVIGEIPIIEYQYNENRMACYEPAITIMDAINEAESCRIDGIEQAVQQLCLAVNCNFEDGVTANTIRQAGMIAIKSVGENKADFRILDSVLDQSATQTTIDDLYEQMLYKCSMPSTTKGGSSTSDTGTAVYLRDGYQMADTAARNTQDLWELSTRLFDRVVLKILKMYNGFELSLSDFEIKLERNSTSNLLVKSQAALNMKQLGLAPEIALGRSGLSNDPLNDIELSRKYINAVWGTENNVEMVDETKTDIVAE